MEFHGKCFRAFASGDRNRRKPRFNRLTAGACVERITKIAAGRFVPKSSVFEDFLVYAFPPFPTVPFATIDEVH
jgi:hypothetical protein